MFYFIYVFSVLIVSIRTENDMLNSDNNVKTTLIEPTAGVISHQLRGFHNEKNGLTSGPIIIVNDKVFYIIDLHFDGNITEAYFWAGEENKPSENGFIIPIDENLHKNLPSYDGQNIYLTLPDGVSVYNIKYLGIWSKKNNSILDYVNIPQKIVLPRSNESINSTLDGRRILRVPKCCKNNQVLKSSGCIDFKPFETFSISVFENNSTHINDEKLNAAQIKFEPYKYNINCPHYKYSLTPTSDNFILLSNGSLLNLDTAMFFSQGDYCLEFLFEEDKWETGALLCGDPQIEDTTMQHMFYIYAVGVVISAIFFIATAGVYLKFAMDARGKCIIGYSISMAITYIVLAVVQLPSVGEAACNFIGFFFQFTLMMSFFWLTMLVTETYRKIKNCRQTDENDETKMFYKYLGASFVTPIIILIISLLTDKIPDIPDSFLKPKFGHNDCWFVGKSQKVYYFYIPVIIIIFINIVLLLLTKKHIMDYDKNLSDENNTPTPILWVWSVDRKKLKQMFRACYCILIIMTLCWTAEVVTYTLDSNYPIVYAIDVIESLQGMFIFFVFVYYNPVKRITFEDWKIKFYNII